MLSVPKTKALVVLRALLARAPALDGCGYQHQDFQLWRKDVLATARVVFGDTSTQFTSFGRLPFGGVHLVDNEPAKVIMRFLSSMQDARSHLTSWINEVENFWPEEACAEPLPSPLETVVALCSRFSDAAARLTRRRTGRAALVMADEWDVQYLLGALLAAQFDDVREEDPVPSHAGATSRVDFFLKTERVIIETKMSRENLRAKEVGEELLVDIARYEARSDCDCLVCLVYDPGRHITNPRGLERDLESTASRLTIRVLVRS